MAKLSTGEIEKIAALAMLGLTGKELDSLALELSSILDFVEALQKVDTTNITPTSQVTGLIDVWRSDEVKPCSLSRQQLLANAPATKNSFIKVQRVLE